MKYFAILDLSDIGDGDCPRWVAVEVIQPTKRTAGGSEPGQN